MVSIKSMKKYINPRNIILLLTLICIYPFWDYLAARIVTPIRCKMWEGKEVEIFLTPEEWRKLSGVKESLKDTEWIYYPTIEGEPEKEPFFIKNQGLYKPVMYFNGNRHSLSIVNSKYPNLNEYIYTQKLFLDMIPLFFTTINLKKLFYNTISSQAICNRHYQD